MLGAVVFNVEHTLYAIISVYIMGKVCDYIVSRGKQAKCAYIISDANETIAREIMDDLDRGVTCLPGTGMYSGKERKILFCICSKKDIVDIKDIVKKNDPRAFFIISDVNEAMGEGFVERWS